MQWQSLVNMVMELQITCMGNAKEFLDWFRSLLHAIKGSGFVSFHSISDTNTCVYTVTILEQIQFVQPTMPYQLSPD